MESVSGLADRLADRGGYDIRLEAAAAKEFNSVQGWEIVDDTMQIRGGRGYETEHSLDSRGEAPVPTERLMRDSRINRIFEGSSEIMHLFMAREAVDVHLQVAGAMIDDSKGPKEKAAALPQIAAFYAKWYPSRFLGWSFWPKYKEFGKLGGHIRFAESHTRALARSMFHGMMIFQAKLQRKQAFLFRAVDIGLYLFAMTASVVRVQHMKDNRHPEAHSAEELADLFCRNAARKVEQLFHEMWHNDDDFKYKVGKNVLKGRYQWLEGGTVGMDRIYDKVPAATAKPAPQPKAAKTNGKPKDEAVAEAKK
jgi:hypothetical protein